MRLKIGTKIGLGFSLIMVMLIILGTSSFLAFNSSKKRLENIGEAQNRLSLQMQIDSEFNAAIGQFRGFVAYGDEEACKDFEKTMDDVIAMENRWYNVALIENKSEVQSLIQLTHQYRGGLLNELAPLVREYYQELDLGNMQKAHELKVQISEKFENNFAPKVKVLEQIIEESVNLNKEIVEDNMQSSLASANKVMVLSLIIIIVSVLLGIALSIYLVRIIANPIITAANYVDVIAKGDLSIDVGSAFLQRQDEIGLLARSVQNIIDNFRSLIGQISSTTELVAASSEQLTANAEQSAQAADQVAGAVSIVAQGADQQLQAIDETTAVVEQMSASIHQVAANANQVAGMSNKAADASKDGGQAVGNAVSQMDYIQKTVLNSAQIVGKLGERSQEIGEIIDTISVIADQTNLLALNAAIEAARAGEEGRGFAVVAEEVRKLAEQSQEAVKLIANLIGEIQADTSKAVEAMERGTREVKVGTEVVNTAGQAFNTISQLISQVSNQIEEISTAISQISQGSEQIVNSIRRIDLISKDTDAQSQSVSSATQEQAASMEEIATSSESLAKMAEDLQDAVNKFKV